MASSSNDKLWNTVCEDKIFKRYDLACDMYQDRYIAIAGGETKTEFLKSAAMYDVTNKSCVLLPDLPFHGSCGGVVLNDYFYVAGVDLYRICLSKRMEWEFLVELNKDESIENMVTDGNHLFMSDELNQITSFDPTNYKLPSIIEFPSEISSEFAQMFQFATLLVDNNIYILQDQQMFIFNIFNRLWSLASPLPESLDGLAAVMIDRWIVVTGTNIRGSCSYTFVYDTHTQIWTQVNTAATSPRRHHKSIKVGSHIITLGGWTHNDEYCPLTAIHIKHIIPEWIWIMLKPYILLRKLLDDKRAAPIIANANKLKLVDSHMNTDTKTNVDAVVQKLFTNLPLEIFRHILMFLK